jgi:hypothetical protein
MATSEISPVATIPGMQTKLPVVDEIKEYEKILRISDEVFAGTHPRLKVPQQFVRKAPSRSLRTPSVATPPVDSATAVPSKTGPSEPSGPSPVIPNSTQEPSAVQSSYSTVPTPDAPPHVAPKLASEIDPIFLTKSDDLVRAEIQLQRRRVENVLRDQFEKSKAESRQKAATHDTRPDFDVTEVLNKAHEIVKPLPSGDIHGANGTIALSDSFDDNSFYSSRAPDSPQHEDPELVSLGSDRQAQDTERVLPANVLVGHEHNQLLRPGASRTGFAEIDARGLYDHADNGISLPSQTHFMSRDKHTATHQRRESMDEPEYSPPEPNVPAVDTTSSDEYHPRDLVEPRRQTHERLHGTSFRRCRSISPAGDVRIVRNHITSPAAPQPSRVSPLATAKVPSIQQLRSSQHGYQPEHVPTDPYSGQVSPEGSLQQLLPRKRRRVQERNISHLRPAESPEPYIKTEPVSPPPFTDDPPARSGQARERPVYIDIASPRHTPSTDRQEASYREPIYELDRYGSSGHEYGTPEIRAVSGLSTRRPVRDTQDLRRVASLHHARHPDTIREYGEPVGLQPRSMRASSYAVVERPTQHERTRYYDEVIPSYPKRYAPIEDLLPSPRYREVYVDEERPSRFVEPVHRRIVVDEHGNQFYEMVPSSKIRAMPPPPIRFAKAEDYNERGHVRNGSVRATSIVDDGYGHRTYVQEMPPPATTYRRVVGYPRGSDEEHRPSSRSLGVREPLRSGSAVVDYAPRRSVYIDDREVPGERLVRTSSVRPPPGPYHEPREIVHRVQSVRPSGRELSVYADDESRAPPEYVERPVYTSVRPAREERYFVNEDLVRARSRQVGEMPWQSILD